MIVVSVLHDDSIYPDKSKSNGGHYFFVAIAIDRSETHVFELIKIAISDFFRSYKFGVCAAMAIAF